MVTAKFMGRLGNQCFQISAAACHAWRTGGIYAFPKKSIAPQLWRTYFDHLPTHPPGRTTLHYYKEPSPHFTPIPDETDITLEGYWQSESYWYDYKEQLQKLLRFEYSPENYISIHHRRGDFLQFADQFPVLPMEYYSKAIDYFLSKGYDQFKVYSDDISWCKKEYAQMGVAFHYSENKDPLTDMRDMYNGAGLIIANSSFSLFAALLRSDNPLVIAPAEDRWFGPANKKLDSKDRMAERFIKL